MGRTMRAAAALAACSVIVGAGASAAVAKTVTKHFFSKQVYQRFTDSSGKPLTSESGLAVGDRLSFASNDYVGNHKHHAKRATASDHIVCTVTGKTTALCDGTIAIGGSLILGDDFVLDFSSNSSTVVKITGGTGRYRHAHGTVTAKPVGKNGNNSDLTIKIR